MVVTVSDINYLPSCISEMDLVGYVESFYNPCDNFGASFSYYKMMSVFITTKHLLIYLKGGGYEYTFRIKMFDFDVWARDRVIDSVL